MPQGLCQGKGGRTLRWGFWELRSGIHGQQQRAGTFEPPALLLFIYYSVPWGLEGTTLGQTMEMTMLLGCPLAALWVSTKAKFMGSPFRAITNTKNPLRLITGRSFYDSE